MKFAIETQGHSQVINITEKVKECVENSQVQSGAVLVFVAGSTAVITILEYESGIIKDLKEVLEKIIPENQEYHHHQKWGDKNGAAHLKAAIFKPDLLIPIENGKLRLGTWQQIVLIDFDEKPRQREVIVQVLS